MNRLRHRGFLYLVLLAYLGTDLLLWNGPLRRSLDGWIGLQRGEPQAFSADQHVATVCGRPISLAQLDREATEQAWRQGAIWRQLSHDEKTRWRRSALDSLILHQLMRTRIAADPQRQEIAAARIDQALASMNLSLGQGDTREQGLSKLDVSNEAELRQRVRAALERDEAIERWIAPQLQISESELEQAYAQQSATLIQPAQRHLRQIFAASLEVGRDAARAKLEPLLAQLQQPEPPPTLFAELASQHSDDPRSRAAGGDLGWQSRADLPADLAPACMELPLHQPTLLPSKLGWHIIEVLEQRDAKPLSMAEARPQLETQLRRQKRRTALQQLQTQLRSENAAAITIHIPPANLP